MAKKILLSKLNFLLSTRSLEHFKIYYENGVSFSSGMLVDFPASCTCT